MFSFNLAHSFIFCRLENYSNFRQLLQDQDKDEMLLKHSRRETEGALIILSLGEIMGYSLAINLLRERISIWKWSIFMKNLGINFL